MVHLVDGNNLLFAARQVLDPDRPPGRWSLSQLLDDWAVRFRHDVHIVFDGPPPAPDQLAQLSFSRVEVSFSGAGRTADDAIAERITEDSAARDRTVVSSDHEVQRAARQRRADVVRSDVFIQRVASDLARPRTGRKAPEPNAKRGGLKPEETDWWLSEFGIDDGRRDRVD